MIFGERSFFLFEVHTVWKGNTVGVVKSLILLLSVTAALSAAMLATAAPGSSRVQAYKYYIQGHQQGRADAMAMRNLHQFPNSMVLQADLQREYMRGYRDGYQLIMR